MSRFYILLTKLNALLFFYKQQGIFLLSSVLNTIKEQVYINNTFSLLRFFLVPVLILVYLWRFLLAAIYLFIRVITWPVRITLIYLYRFLVLWYWQVRVDCRFIFNYISPFMYYFKRVIKMFLFFPRELLFGFLINPFMSYLSGSLLRHKKRYPRFFFIILSILWFSGIILYGLFLRLVNLGLELFLFLLFSYFLPYIVWRGPTHAGNYAGTLSMWVDILWWFFEWGVAYTIIFVCFLILLGIQYLYRKRVGYIYFLRLKVLLFYRLWLGLNTWREDLMLRVTLHLLLYVVGILLFSYMLFWLGVFFIVMVLFELLFHSPLLYGLFVILPCIVTIFFCVIQLIMPDTPLTRRLFLLQFGRWVSIRLKCKVYTEDKDVIDDFASAFAYLKGNGDLEFRYRYLICKFYPIRLVRLVYFFCINTFLILFYRNDQKKIFLRYPAEDFNVFDSVFCPFIAVKVGPFYFRKCMNKKGVIYYARYRPFFEWWHGTLPYEEEIHELSVLRGRHFIGVFYFMYLALTLVSMWLVDTLYVYSMFYGVSFVWPWDDVYEPKVARFWRRLRYFAFFRRILKTFIYEFLYNYIFSKTWVNGPLTVIHKAAHDSKVAAITVELAMANQNNARQKYDDTLWSFQTDQDREDADIELNVLYRIVLEAYDKSREQYEKEKQLIKDSHKELGSILTFILLYLLEDPNTLPPDFMLHYKKYWLKRTKAIARAKKKKPDTKEKRKERERKALEERKQWAENDERKKKEKEKEKEKEKKKEKD